MIRLCSGALLSPFPGLDFFAVLRAAALLDALFMEKSVKECEGLEREDPEIVEKQNGRNFVENLLHKTAPVSRRLQAR